MSSKISKQTKAELLGALRDVTGGPPNRRSLESIDEFVAVAGWHRKHAIRLLTADRHAAALAPDTFRPLIGGPTARAVRSALVVLWEAADRICGKGRQGGIVPPPSVLAPESALGSVPTVALSSAQVTVVVHQHLCQLPDQLFAVIVLLFGLDRGFLMDVGPKCARYLIRHRSVLADRSADAKLCRGVERSCLNG